VCLCFIQGRAHILPELVLVSGRLRRAGAVDLGPSSSFSAVETVPLDPSLRVAKQRGSAGAIDLMLSIWHFALMLLNFFRF